MAKSPEALDEHISAISDTQSNLTGLIEKMAGVQTELMSAGFMDFSNDVGQPFSTLSKAAEECKELVEKMEIERNRLRNEQ